MLDHPANLCRSLAKGHLDVALVSSFEFLRNPIYRIVDEISISSDGPVYSVVVAHTDEIEDLTQIELDPAAETSVNLLRCLLSHVGLHPEFVRISESPLSKARGRLLIGDQAIRFRHGEEHTLKFWDLGEQWKSQTGLPFVYALWLVRPEVADPDQMAEKLRNLAEQNLRDVARLISDADDRDFCMRYYREHLRFSFGTEEKKGLELFHRLCAKYRLLPKSEFKLDLV